MRSRWVIVGTYVATMALLVAGVVVLIRHERGGNKNLAAAPLPELADMPFPSSLTVGGTQQVTLGSEVPVVAAAYGPDGAKQIDLYDGSRRVATVKPDVGEAVAMVRFPALTVGPHLVHAEITDRKGRVAMTAAEPVDVYSPPADAVPVAVAPGAPIPDLSDDPAGVPAPGVEPAPLVVTVTPDEGESPQDLAKRFGVEAGQLRAVSVADGGPSGGVGQGAVIPDLATGKPIPPGVGIAIEVKRDAGQDDLASKSVLVTGKGADRKGVALPLSAQADGCNVVLTSSQGGDQPTFYEANVGVHGWKSVGKARSGGTLRLSPSPGPHSYLARLGERSSATVSVTAPNACDAGTGWSGDARIVDGTLYLSGPSAAGTSSAYLYLQVDGGTAQRIPEGTFAQKGYATDIADLIPTLSGSTLDLEVWTTPRAPVGQGRSDGEMADPGAPPSVPVRLGAGRLDVPDGQTIADIIGEPGSIKLSSAPAPVDPKARPGATPDDPAILRYKDATLTYNWDAASSGVDEVMWQVLSAPPTQGEDPLTPPSLVAAGISSSVDRTEGSTGSKGTFSFDTAKIPGHEEVAARQAEVAANKPATPLSAPSAPQAFAILKPPVTAGTVTSLAGSRYAARLPQSVGRTVLAPLPEAGAGLYVRVIANPKGPSVGPSSNVSYARLPVPQPAENGITGLTLTGQTLDVDAGRAPNPQARRCGYVTLPTPETIAKYDGPPRPNGQPGPLTLAIGQKYGSGSGLYCMPPPKPPKGCVAKNVPVVGGFICAVGGVVYEIAFLIVSFLGGLYGGVSFAYNAIVQKLVEAVAKYNPVCLALRKAKPSVAKGCEQVFSVVAGIAISVAATYFGFPPTLPSLEALEGIAEGDLSAVAVELMKSQGVPCDAVKPTPEVETALGLAGDALGEPGAAAVASDLCLALAKAFVGNTVKLLRGQLTAGTVQQSGLPDFSQIEGFSIAPDPRSLPVPMRVSYQAKLAKFDADATGSKCGMYVTTGSSFPADKSRNPYHPFYAFQTLQLTSDPAAGAPGGVTGEARFANYSGYFANYPGGDAGPLDSEVAQADLIFNIGVAPYGGCKGGDLSYVNARIAPPDS